MQEITISIGLERRKADGLGLFPREIPGCSLASQQPDQSALTVEKDSDSWIRTAQSLIQSVSFFPSLTCFAYAMIGEKGEAFALSLQHDVAQTDHEKRAPSYELRRRLPD
jgi:hypothetical protein